MITTSNNVLLAAKNLSLGNLWQNLSFVVRTNGILQIVGANGTGKTSLINVLCGLVMPDNGQIFWRQKNIYQHAEDYRKELAYVGHKHGIKYDFTPYQSLAFVIAMRQASLSHDAADKKIKVALHRWQINNLNKPCRFLSAGQCRRVALARLLLMDTNLWVLDEPLTTLDNNGQQILVELISEHVDAGGAVILSTHQAMDLQVVPQILNLN